MTDYNDTADKGRDATDSIEDEPTQLVAAGDRDARLARIERKQEYTHTLLAGTMAVVAAATMTITGSTAWGLAAAAGLALTLAFAWNWKTTPRSLQADD